MTSEHAKQQNVAKYVNFKKRFRKRFQQLDMRIFHQEDKSLEKKNALNIKLFFTRTCTGKR